MKLDILVADDHAIIRDGLKKIIDDEDDLCVAGEASNASMVMEKIRQRDWSLLILDLSMPGRSGVDLIHAIKAENAKLPILIFSMHPEEQYAVRSIKAGASGYLSKESDSDFLLPAIRKVIGGGMFISSRVAELLAENVAPNSKDIHLHNKLSNREFEIFSSIVRGKTLSEIAEELSLSIKTVSTHKTHILEKLGVSNQVDMVRYALEHGLLDSFGN